MPKEIIKAIEKLHVVVIGDVMVDRYLSGNTERISPEAPVPIINISKSEDRLGGAANVALNCKVLGAKVSVASVVGMDSDGEVLLQLLKDNHIDGSLIIKSATRKTTCKTRILSRNQQMIRYDQEQEDDLNIRDEHAFIDLILRFLQIQKPDIVIFEDYNKGVLKDNVIEKVIRHCHNLKIFIAVDPKKRNFLSYKGVNLFKPNLKEIREGLNIPLQEPDISSLSEAHELLKQELEHQITLITLSEKGMFFQKKEERNLVSSHPRKIADVSGAGDSVIAIASMVYAVTKNLNLMAEFANIAGGLVCEKVGVAPIDQAKFIQEIQLYMSQKDNIIKN